MRVAIDADKSGLFPTEGSPRPLPRQRPPLEAGLSRARTPTPEPRPGGPSDGCGHVTWNTKAPEIAGGGP